MNKGLRKQIDRFYEEMKQEESHDLGELSFNLVLKLDYEIERLEKENMWLYGKLNMISEIIEKGRNEKV